ncbi:hypothetical protein IPM62_04000 [Candidatus Woesebacteria bacterium]|nr:MAG: hypothetical protein IPM62_04000 [Candidatus Woesebacteria bacterium]
MSDTKILQTLIDGQVKLQKQIEDGFKQVNTRLDIIGSDVAHLQDDAPTVDEFDQLVERVYKVEKKVATFQ